MVEGLCVVYVPQVLASYGHLRDLPAKSGSVLPDEDFRMLWSVLPKAAPRWVRRSHLSLSICLGLMAASCFFGPVGLVQ